MSFSKKKEKIDKYEKKCINPVWMLKSSKITISSSEKLDCILLMFIPFVQNSTEFGFI